MPRFLCIIELWIVFGLTPTLLAQTLQPNQHNHSADSAPTEAERKSASVVLDASEHLDEKLLQYVVMAEVQLTSEDLRKKNAHFFQSNYIQCIHRKLGIERYDSIEPAFSSYDMIATNRKITAISNKKEFRRFASGRLLSALNLRDDATKEEKEKAKNPYFNMVMFDPFYTSIAGYDGFTPRGPFLMSRPQFSKYRITRVEEDIKHLGMELLMSEKYQIYMRIVFDTALGGVPIESRMVSCAGGELELGLVSTKWGKFNSVPVPLEILALQLLGSEKTGTKYTFEIKLHWRELPGDQFAMEDFFNFRDEKLIISPDALMEYVRAGSTISKTR